MPELLNNPTTFEDIENLYCGTVYPNLSEFEGDTALCLFCAEWLGRQDAYWVANHGLIGTCVDLNRDKLRDMQEVYPEGWEFVAHDVYDFAKRFVAAGKRQWDVVTLDPWTGQFEKCAEWLPVWTALARKRVILGHGHYRLARPEAPEGWTLTDAIKRSDFKGGIYWLVYDRD